MPDDSIVVPAASLADLDLSAVPAATAAEILRLERLMAEGEETPEQSVELVRLIRDAVREEWREPS